MPGHKSNNAKKAQRKAFNLKHPEGRKAFAKAKRKKHARP